MGTKTPEMIINGLLLYLSNCASLLASPRSITSQGFLTASPQVWLRPSRAQPQTLVVQTLSSKPPRLLLRVSVSLCLSPSPRLQGCRYCSVSCLCWSLTLFLWLCTLSDPVSPFSSSFLLFGVPPSHPALGRLSVFCWVCDFGIYPKAAVGSHLCCIWHDLNFSDVWIHSLMSIKMLEAVLARKAPPLAFALNLTASGFDPQLCCWSKLEK